MSENTKPCVNFNENGKVIYKKDSKGFEEWYEYDKNNNEIHYKDSNGYEEWYEYDKNGNCIHYKDSNMVRKENVFM